MSFARYLFLALRHHWRGQLSVLCATLVGSAVLVGALAVGDSVRASLAERVGARVGRVEQLLLAREAAFPADLGQRLAARSPGSQVAAVLELEGVISTPDGRARKSGIGVHGVTSDFFRFAPRPSEPAPIAPGRARLGLRLASELGVEVGDRIVVRVPKPSALSRDLALAQTEDAVLSLALEVESLLGPEDFADFALDPRGAAYGCFVEREWLAERLGWRGRANALLEAGGEPEVLAAALAAAFVPNDAQLAWRADPERGFVELTSERILLPGPVVRAVEAAGVPALGILTYFVNAIEAGEGRSTPYSTVAAIGPLVHGEVLSEIPSFAFPSVELAADRIAISDWLAEDLGARAGDELTLAYYAPSGSERLAERRARLTVAAVLPLAPPLDDASLMPDFPGISESAHCRDWEPGIPIDLDRIRDKDERWWDERKGTPKAWLSLAAARELFANRFGELTAVRVPLSQAERAAAGLAQHLSPAALGLELRPIVSPAERSGQSATDFGGLFLGLSFFQLAAAALLVALGFSFSIESRSREIGTLRALGFLPRRIALLVTGEALPLAALGALLGAPLGLAYSAGLLALLRGQWSAAVGSTSLAFHVQPASLVYGALGALLVAWLAMAWTLRKLVRRPVPELLASGAGFLEREAVALERRPRPAWIALGAGLLLAGGTTLVQGKGEAGGQALRHFGAGCGWLVAFLAAARMRLASHVRRDASGALDLGLLGVRNAARRPGRSLATLALFGGTIFLVATLSLHQVGADTSQARSSGGGGFDFVGRSSLPLYHDPSTSAGQEALGLEASRLADLGWVAGAVHPGEDASCLELMAPTHPTLVGIDPSALARRAAFRFTDTLEETHGSPWLALSQEQPDGALPAIGDQAMLQWQLHKGLGEAIEYVDEQGRSFPVRIVGALADSVLQGSLFVDRQALVRRYPSTSGSRYFLVERGASEASELRAYLQQRLSDAGLELEPCSARLAELHAVQNTYLLVFQMLSGLGLLLGSLGLGLLVLRNTLERRSEYALLLAVGLERASVLRLLLSEHLWLLAAGGGSGALAALLALQPFRAGAARALPPLTAVATLVAAFAAGALAVLAAARLATRSLTAGELREER